MGSHVWRASTEIVSRIERKIDRVTTDCSDLSLVVQFEERKKQKLEREKIGLILGRNFN